ncbi:hypothetical protein KAW08_00205 [bacterium]|nr:hypothetical protein [bacterium]
MTSREIVKRNLEFRNPQRIGLNFSGEDGGFIAKNYGDIKGIGVKSDWDQWAYESFLKNKRISKSRI